MLSERGKSIHTTRSLPVAVALATCGVPCTIERMIDEPTGEQASCLFHLEPRPLLNLPGPDGSPALDFSTGMVLIGLRNGSFALADPCHPVCDSIAGLEIYECIRTFMERAIRFQIAKVINGNGRAALVRGHEPMADGKRPAIRTESLALAAALVRMGVPLLGVEGERPHRRLILARHGYPLAPPSQTVPPAWIATSGAIDALKFTEAINDGTLAKTHHDHPALYVLMALHNREQFMSEINHGRHAILVRDPRSHAWAKRCRSAIVPSDSDGKTFDRARDSIRR